MSKKIDPSTLNLGDNPFAHALAEGAGGTYLALAKAGLADRFDPLPVDADGRSLAPMLFGHSSNVELLAPLAQTLREFGLDVCQEARPADDYCASSAMSQCGVESPSVAALAMVRSIDDKSHGFWIDLPSERLLGIAPHALPMAAALSQPNVAAMRAMLEAGADANGLAPNGQPLVGLCDRVDGLRLLTEFGADLRAHCPERKAPRHRRAERRLDMLLNDASEYDDARKVRLFAIEWAGKHPDPQAPGAELSKLAFDAIEAKDKKLFAACVSALGPKLAKAALDEHGRTLAVAAARKGLYAEAEKLALAQGPFDVAPCGDSAWGMLLTRVHKAGSGGSFGNKRDAERLHKALGAIAASSWEPRWDASEPGRPSLLESLVGKLPLAEFLGHLESARAAGFDGERPLSSGMDLPCALLCWLASSAPGGHGPGVESHWALARVALQEMNPQGSPDAVKAAFARHFLHAVENYNPSLSASMSHGAPTRLLESCDEGFPREPHADRKGVLDLACATLREGMELLGALGEPMPERLGKPSHNHYFTSTSLAELRGRFERGALSSAPAPNAHPKSSPRL